MPTVISREGSVYEPIVVTDNPATTGGFSLNIHAGAMLMVDSVSAGGTVTMSFYVKADERFAEQYLYCDASNTAVTLTIQAGRCYELPSGLFASRYIQPVVSSGTAQIRYSTKG